MKSNIIKIGELEGVIIPQNLLNECLINNEINIEVVGREIVITALGYNKRAGWGTGI